MSRPRSPSPLALATVAGASFTAALALAACVHTVSGPLPQAQPVPAHPVAAAPSTAGGGYGYGYGGAGDAAYASGGYGGYGYGGAGYGGAGYGGATYGATAPASVDVYACRVDADCTVYFRTQACFPADPIGVATAQLAAARRLMPQRHEACGMGGPDYERRRMANEGRYVARCEQQRCAVTDRGPQRTPF